MTTKLNLQFLLDVWTIKDGKRLHPYQGLKGSKKGLYSVNFTNDTKKFQGMTEEQLIKAVETGKFAERGTIRMLPLDVETGTERNAYSPTHYKGELIPKRK